MYEQINILVENTYAIGDRLREGVYKCAASMAKFIDELCKICSEIDEDEPREFIQLTFCMKILENILNCLGENQNCIQDIIVHSSGASNHTFFDSAHGLEWICEKQKEIYLRMMRIEEEYFRMKDAVKAVESNIFSSDKLREIWNFDRCLYQYIDSSLELVNQLKKLVTEHEQVCFEGPDESRTVVYDEPKQEKDNKSEESLKIQNSEVQIKSRCNRKIQPWGSGKDRNCIINKK